jgi:hypothetical protein
MEDVVVRASGTVRTPYNVDKVVSERDEGGLLGGKILAQVRGILYKGNVRRL